MRKMQMESEIRIPLKPHIKLRMLKTWGKIAVIGLPITLSTGIVALGMGTVNKILAGSYGSIAVASWMIGIRVEDLASNTIIGIQNALVPFLGFNYGKGDFPRMKHGIVSAFKIAAVITGGLSALIFAFPHPVIALFRPSEQIAAVAAQAIRITLLGMPAIGFAAIMNSFFTSTGFTVFGLIVQIMRSMVFRIFIVSYLASRVSIHYIWWFQPISFSGGAFVSLFFAWLLVRKLRRDMGDDGAGWFAKERHASEQ